MGSSSSRRTGGVDGWVSGSGDGICVVSSVGGRGEGLGTEFLGVYGFRCWVKGFLCREFRGLKE